MSAECVVSAEDARHREDDAGSVTVEAAFGICAVLTVFALLIGGFGLLIAQLRCTDAAVAAARLVARGEQDRAREAVFRLAPERSTLRVTVRGEHVRTRVHAPALGGWSGLERSVTGSATALAEPGAQPEPSVTAGVGKGTVGRDSSFGRSGEIVARREVP